MSYILDALKKSQAEQSAEGVALKVQATPSKSRVSPWLAGGLGLLAVNAVLLLWILATDQFPSTDKQGPAGVASDIAIQPAPEPSLPPVQVVNPVTPPSTAPPPTMPPTAAPTPRPQPAPSVPRLTLSELLTSEQSLYRGFNYSTHIYTDDPALCAIVIDGQRLAAGDAFKGLQVVAITEAGVVFQENRRGVVREVEVVLMELWED